MTAPPASRLRRFGPIALLCSVAFAGYAYFRAREVGGCDDFAYLAQSQLFIGHDLVRVALDPGRHPALVPLCMEFTGARMVGIFPIGYPLLLAAAGLFHAEFFLNPALGAASIALLYAAMVQICGRWAALALAVLWATAPIVAWGATQLMSDLSSAVFVLAAYLGLLRGNAALSGGLAGFALGIRPTNMVVVPLLAFLARRSRALRPFAIALSIVGTYFVVYDFGTHGALFAPEYRDNTHAFGTANLSHNLRLLLSETALEFWPVLLLGACAVVRCFRKSIALLCWFGAYLGFYCLFRELDDWWYTRYLLPCYAALFLLAAHGARELALLTRKRLAGRRPATALLVTAPVAVLPVLSMRRADELVYRPTREVAYAVDSRRVAKIVPRGSLVGALNFSGPLRLYGGVESFDWRHPQALELVEWGLARKRDVYLLIEPSELANPLVRRFFDNYTAEDVAELSSWHGLKLQRIRAGTERPLHHDTRVVLIDIGTPGARSFLGQGWSLDDNEGGRSFAWVVGKRATLSVPLVPHYAYELGISVSPLEVESRRQYLRVRFNGSDVMNTELLADRPYRSATVFAPLVRQTNVVELLFAYAGAPGSPDPGAGDGRQRVAAVDFVSFRLLQSEQPGGPETRFVNFDQASTLLLGVGWSGIELDPSGDSLCWCAARSCSLWIQGRPLVDRKIVARLAPLTDAGLPPQVLDLFLNDVALGKRTLPNEMAVMSFDVPRAAWQNGKNELRFEFARAGRPRSRAGDQGDQRTLAARFDWVEIAAP